MLEFLSFIRKAFDWGERARGSLSRVIELARELLRTRRRLVLGVGVLIALLVVVFIVRGPWGAGAQTSAGPRTVSVEVATAVKKNVRVRLEALGTVTTVASVAIKSRVDTEIVGVHFSDGAKVKQGETLFTLDSRSIEAQIRQAEGMLARDQAQLDGAERDVRRYTDLVAKGATPTINLDNAMTQADTFRAAMKADQASLDNFKIQLTYCTISAPISGRISSAAVKVGNFVRQADLAPLATINQVAPIYVSFALPQLSLSDVRRALAAETATLEAILPGDSERSTGQVTMIENSVDAATGMVTIRATMPNKDELLWPGTLVNTQLTLRTEDRIVIPATALQVSQTGTFVFVVKDGAVSVRPVKVERTVDGESAIESGVEAGEVVVTDGQLLLSNGTKVTQRNSGSS
jgi:membrane fusion protein, multidrug efflux system